MTKKDYVVIANTILRLRPEIQKEVIDQFITTLKNDNYKFDVSMFMNYVSKEF
jgi:hypothetical protein